MTGRAIRRVPAQPSPLTIDEVYDQVARHATTRPLTTAEITEYCRAFHDYPGITDRRVWDHLRWLHRRDRVRSWTGEDPALADYGIIEPVRHARYWAMPDIKEP